MLFASLSAFLLSSAPVFPELGEISAPFGHFGNVVNELPAGGFSDADKVVAPRWKGCPAKGVYLMRNLSGSMRALEQLQLSLNAAEGAETKLFGRKGVLSELMTQLTSAQLKPKVRCNRSALADGFKMMLPAAPQKWCEGKVDAGDGEFWFFTGSVPSAVISVQKGAAAEPCQPRLSTVLFDGKGQARVRVHADWAGAVSATLVGDGCESVNYIFSPATQTFIPRWITCKRR